MSAPAIHIGLDFDNTIVSYDGLFHLLALERSLIPAEIPPSKTAVRDHLRSAGREDQWTALQGIAYGERMGGAAPFPGVFDFMRAALRDGAKLSIISHRTQHPIVGEPVDLHSAARSWLKKHGVLDLVSAADIHFELTRAGKARRLSAAGCDYFVDDLPEFLSDRDFPDRIERILFDPTRTHAPDDRWRTVGSWRDFGNHPLEFLAGIEH
jgi:hypothetical protein